MEHTIRLSSLDYKLYANDLSNYREWIALVKDELGAIAIAASTLGEDENALLLGSICDDLRKSLIALTQAMAVLGALERNVS